MGKKFGGRDQENCRKRERSLEREIKKIGGRENEK